MCRAPESPQQSERCICGPRKDKLGFESRHYVLAAATPLVLLLAAFASVSAQTQTLPATTVTATVFAAGQAGKLKGLIISRNGDDMVLRDDAGGMDVVTLTADTKISSPSGLFKMDKKHRDVSNLLPGLIVEIKGSGGDRGNSRGRQDQLPLERTEGRRTGRRGDGGAEHAGRCKHGTASAP